MKTKNLILAVLLSAGLALPALAQQRPGVEDFLQAAKRGDSQTVSVYLAQGGNVNAMNIHEETYTGQTALMLAAAGGYTDIVSQLLQAGAELELKSDAQWPSLSNEVVKGKTAFMHAVLRNQIDTAKQLLEAGADINTKSYSVTHAKSTEPGKTPLMYAILQEHVDMVKFLLEAGADPTVKSGYENDHNRKTAMEYAKEIGNADIVQLLRIQQAQRKKEARQALKAQLKESFYQTITSPNLWK